MKGLWKERGDHAKTQLSYCHSNGKLSFSSTAFHGETAKDHSGSSAQIIVSTLAQHQAVPEYVDMRREKTRVTRQQMSQSITYMTCTQARVYESPWKTLLQQTAAPRYYLVRTEDGLLRMDC